MNRLNSSPFFIVVDYQGLKVGPITELRKRLVKAGAEMHVVKNSIFRIAAREAGVADLAGTLAGQLAVVTGRQDVSTAAKVIKTFSSEFDKPKIKFGHLNNQRLENNELLTLADLPSLEVLRGTCSGAQRPGHAPGSASQRPRPSWSRAQGKGREGLSGFIYVSRFTFTRRDSRGVKRKT